MWMNPSNNTLTPNISDEKGEQKWPIVSLLVGSMKVSLKKKMSTNHMLNLVNSTNKCATFSVNDT